MQDSDRAVVTFLVTFSEGALLLIFHLDLGAGGSGVGIRSGDVIPTCFSLQA